MLNKAIIDGRLTRDPELRHTQNGAATATFSVACERDFKSKVTGERVTDFFSCVAWNKIAENMGRLVHKGNRIIVEGRLQVREWTTKDGSQRKEYEILVEQWRFVEPPLKREVEPEPDPEPVSCGCDDGGTYSTGELKKDPFKELDDDDLFSLPLPWDD